MKHLILFFTCTTLFLANFSWSGEGTSGATGGGHYKVDPTKHLPQVLVIHTLHDGAPHFFNSPKNETHPRLSNGKQALYLERIQRITLNPFWNSQNTQDGIEGQIFATHRKHREDWTSRFPDAGYGSGTLKLNVKRENEYEFSGFPISHDLDSQVSWDGEVMTFDEFNQKMMNLYKKVLSSTDFGDNSNVIETLKYLTYIQKTGAVIFVPWCSIIKQSCYQQYEKFVEFSGSNQKWAYNKCYPNWVEIIRDKEHTAEKYKIIFSRRNYPLNEHSHYEFETKLQQYVQTSADAFTERAKSLIEYNRCDTNAYDQLMNDVDQFSTGKKTWFKQLAVDTKTTFDESYMKNVRNIRFQLKGFIEEEIVPVCDPGGMHRFINGKNAYNVLMGLVE